MRGMFIKKRTKPLIRTAATLTACVMLIMCLTTACQPTPKNSSVIGKDAEAPENAVQFDKSDFPDTYQDSYSKNWADIVFDADVALPDSENLPAYEISPATFSQIQVDSIVKGILGDQQIYAPSQVTKSEIEPAYLQALADLHDKENNPDQYENTLEYYQERVNELEEQIKNAPEKDYLEPISTKLKKSSEKGLVSFNGRGDLGKDQMARLSILNNTDNQHMGDNSLLRFSNGNQYIDMSMFYSGIEDNGPANLTITREEAISKADNMISRMGVEDMKYAGWATGILYSRNQQYPASFDSERPQAFLIYYTRNVNGVPVTYDARDDNSGSMEDAYSIPTMYERIMVAVDDSGVTYIRWQGPISVEKSISKNNQVIPFDDVITLAKNQLSYTYATCENQQQSSENTMNQPQPLDAVNKGQAVSNEVHIQRITLGLMQLPIKNQNNKNELIPVWDFFGYYQTNYDSGEKEIHYMNNKSLLTINALNGNIIDRTKGY